MDGSGVALGMRHIKSICFYDIRHRREVLHLTIENPNF
jgi:hypothetical protein